MEAIHPRTQATGRWAATALLALMAALAMGAPAAVAAQGYTAIPNGETYLDSAGVPIQAHGGFTVKHEGMYYWVGEDKTHNRASFRGVAMYKSADLKNWQLVGSILTPETLDVYGNKVLAHCKIERPKILFNQATGKFVLWGHWETYDGYGPSRVVVATASNIEGPYVVTAKGHFRPGEGNTEGVGYHVGIPTPDYGATPDASGNYPTFLPKPAYPPQMASGAASNELLNFGYDTTLKAVAVVLDAEGYATGTRSAVNTVQYNIGATPSTTLAAPVIAPFAGAGTQVVVNANKLDNAYITSPTAGASIYYTVDGGTPVPGAAGTTLYADGAAIKLDANKTVKAIAVRGGAQSTVATVNYALAPTGFTAPIYPPVISVPGGNYADAIAAVKIYATSSGTTTYFTADGKDPDPPLKGGNMGFGSRDFSVFLDPATGKAYLVTAQDHVYLRVWQLSADFTDVVPSTQYAMFINQAREAPALVRHGDYIYMLTSKQSGWYPNQLLYTRTLDIANSGGWEAQRPIGDNTGFHSQPTQIINTSKTATPEYVYLGDRWNPALLGGSTYVWLPLSLEADGGMRFAWTPRLHIDDATGKASGVPDRLVSLNKPVTATANVASSATARRTADQANDGIIDQAAHFYQPTGVPFFWQVDLQQEVDLARIDLSLRSVGGSDAAHRYKVSGSHDGATWTQLFDNSANSRVGFQSHPLSGTYRHVRIDVSQVWDMVHNQGASWSAGIFEASVYAKPGN
jgi:hypothetical protein